MSDSQDAAGGESAPEDLSNSILYEVIDDHICRITLNRPHRRNAIAVPDMNEKLALCLEQAQDDDRVKVVILAANGPDFCAGEDTRKVPVETYGLKKGSRLPQSIRMRQIRKTYESMQRGLIRQCPGKQRRPGFLLFKAEPAKAALPGWVQVSFDTYGVVHATSSADLSRFTASALCAERRAREDLSVSPLLWDKYSRMRAVAQSSKVCQRE